MTKTIRPSRRQSHWVPGEVSPVTEPFLTLPRDPAEIAAGLMLTRSLQAKHLTFAEAGSDRVVGLIQVSETSWTMPALAAWQALARNGQRPMEGFRHGYREDGNWYCLAPVEAEYPYRSRSIAEAFAEVVTYGRHCAAFISDLAWVPDDLVIYADHHFALTALTGAEVGTVAL